MLAQCACKENGLGGLLTLLRLALLGWVLVWTEAEAVHLRLLARRPSHGRVIGHGNSGGREIGNVARLSRGQKVRSRGGVMQRDAAAVHIKSMQGLSQLPSWALGRAVRREEKRQAGDEEGDGVLKSQGRTRKQLTQDRKPWKRSNGRWKFKRAGKGYADGGGLGRQLPDSGG